MRFCHSPSGRAGIVSAVVVVVYAGIALADGVTTFTISRNDDVHECFPSLCRTDTGRIVLAYRESDEHVPSKYARLIVRYSDDGGDIWSERLVLVATSADEPVEFVKYNCPKVQQLKDGRLLYLCDRFVSNPSKDKYERYLDSRIVFWFSDDKGQTWSEPFETSVGGVMPDEVVELDDGTWLLATQLPCRETESSVQYVTRSTDGGKTWGEPIVVAQRRGYDFCEASILKCTDGLLVCYMRENSFLGRPIYKCFSSDGGLTWSEPHETLMDGGHRPVSHLTRDGHVLITYRYYPGAGVGMQNTFAYVESQESARESERSKQRGVILPIDHDSHERPDSGYTGWVELEAGHFLAVNYARCEAPMAQIRGIRFTLDDF